MERMATVPEDGALPAGPSRVNDYDSFATAYAAENETGLANAYYERPAMLALAADVAGRRLRIRPPVRGVARPGRHRDRHRQQRWDAGAGTAAARRRRAPAAGRPEQ